MENKTIDSIRVQEAKLRHDLQLRNEGLVKALEKAVKVIKGWRDMDANRLEFPDKEDTWKIYYEHAPEMKPIRQALTQYNKCDAMGHFGGEPKPEGICPKCNKNW